MGRVVVYDPSRTFNSATLTGSYQDFGAAFDSEVIGWVCFNTSNVAVQLSFDDGATDGVIIPANSVMSDGKYNQDNQSETGRCLIRKNAQMQIKQVTAAGVGSIHFNAVRV